MNVAEYLFNLYKRRYTTFVVTGGQQYYMEGGELIPVKQFDAMYPLTSKINNNYKGESPDHSRYLPHN